MSGARRGKLGIRLTDKQGERQKQSRTLYHHLKLDKGAQSTKITDVSVQIPTILSTDIEAKETYFNEDNVTLSNDLKQEEKLVKRFHVFCRNRMSSPLFGHSCSMPKTQMSP